MKLEENMYVRTKDGRIAKIEEIEEFDDKLQDKEKRWGKVKQYIANIYDMDLDDEDDYDYYDD